MVCFTICVLLIIGNFCVLQSPLYLALHPLITFPKCFEILCISYKNMMQPIFVSALHCTPDGIAIFVGLLRPKTKGKRKEKNKETISIFLKMKIALYNEVCVLCSKQENS